MTYNVFGGMLNLALSIYPDHWQEQRIDHQAEFDPWHDAHELHYVTLN